MKCDICIHGKLCIYRVGYEELNTKVRVLPTEDFPFSVEVNCKHYREISPVPRNLADHGSIGGTITPRFNDCPY
jgi:hypothetical protein